MHKLQLQKPDGRTLVLYGRAPIDAAEAPAAGQAGDRASHLRYHPLRDEWIVYAGHRQHRTFLPPPEWNPLAATIDPAHPTEVPRGNWDVAVFENLFSALGTQSATAPPAIVPTRPCGGTCEVVVFTQDQTASLGSLSLDHLEIVIAAWADRTATLSARDDVEYVFVFENRGVEVGVTLHHPHGQIYAYPFVPPIPERELTMQRIHFERHGTGLLEQLLANELEAEQRILHATEAVAAWVPVCARWAYEVWIAPRRRVGRLPDLTDVERRELARALQIVLRKLDALWKRPMPYILSIAQAPARGDHPYAHLRIEIYPWLRMPGRLKYLAGSEVGAGVFTADTLPEDKAAELRGVEVAHD
ncbi:MAG: galactose-1-phosphate uridylyltransferase [Myxococcota bacterium]|nr:galactose-1-phosphate uridylyltransferase [Deltaproteobacteria bacterium]MDQ3336586.1 galactose-1-phosphate uridylyltransferase [Myxococcota bacterium]